MIWSQFLKENNVEYEDITEELKQIIESNPQKEYFSIWDFIKDNDSFERKINICLSIGELAEQNILESRWMIDNCPTLFNEPEDIPEDLVKTSTGLYLVYLPIREAN